MMEYTRTLIEAEDYAGACDQLADIYKKCDGVPKPPDFVTGEAASELAFMIHDLQLKLPGCE